MLAADGLTATAETLDRVERLDEYDAVVLGSAVYMGRWLAPARAFVEQHAEALRARPTWLFSSGPIGDPPRPAADSAVDVDDLVTATNAREHRLFGGRVDKHRLGFGERAMMLAFRADDGDFRDWAAIEDWAHAIARDARTARPRADMLTSGASPTAP